MTLRVPPAILALAALASPEDAASAATRRAPAFGVALDVVGLSVSVTDDRSRFVGDLREDDFTVLEDGVPQKLFLFEREDVPISLVLMIDASASMHEPLRAAQDAALRLVRTLGPRDRVQVVAFADRTWLAEDFTAEQPAIERAIRGIHASGFTALRNALYDVLRRAARLRRSGELRRIAVVLLSDGADTQSLVTEDDVLELARGSDVTIHAIGLRPRRLPRESRLLFAQAGHFLASVARATGGEVCLPSSSAELDAFYDRIAETFRTQYVLGYVPSDARRERGWRRIQVRVSGRPGLAARHRPGYYARPR